jgi:hypothetical protein
LFFPADVIYFIIPKKIDWHLYAMQCSQLAHTQINSILAKLIVLEEMVEYIEGGMGPF